MTLTQQYPFVGTNYDAVQGLLLVVTALLISVNTAMLIYHLREHALSAAQGTTSVAGVLSLFGATASLAFLPLDGLEFALVALVLSVFWLARGMRGGEINGCPVDLG